MGKLKFLRKFGAGAGLAAGVLLMAGLAGAATVSDTDKYAWSETSGWINFRPSHGGVVVNDTYLSGYAWAENFGWVKLGAESGGPYANLGAGDWGVNRDAAGNLSGFAWSETVGWINFKPTHSQVVIDPVTGVFSGYAWGENVGWIHFGNPPTYRVAIDSDGDGVADVSDICPGYADQVDTDVDGTPDGCDLCPGFDDKIDSDGDGVPDNCDICPGFDDKVDNDGDGVPDNCDICPGFDDKIDSDLDGVPDGCDICPGANDKIDSDVDGVADGCDLCPGFDDKIDSDGDGVPDSCDICPGLNDKIDSDVDGVPDGCDICAGFSDHVDSDLDGVPDGCDICAGADDRIDADGDGVPDGCDNCPTLSNASQGDVNGNRIGDVCDTASDTDRDGLSDAAEITAGTNLLNPDTDGDGIFDGQEVAAGTDPLDPLSQPVITQTIRHDVNGDGNSDLLWHNTDGTNELWLVAPEGSTPDYTGPMGKLPPRWLVIGTGDFNGDGNIDLLYQDSLYGRLQVCLTSADGLTMAAKAWLNDPLPGKGWKFFTCADFNGDGRDDILWHNVKDGSNQVWLLAPNGLAVTAKSLLGKEVLKWTLLATGDFNADGRADLLYRDESIGRHKLWLTSANGLTMATGVRIGLPILSASGWRFNSVADLNGDGADDILWHNPATGANQVWYTNPVGPSVSEAQWFGQLSTAWTLLDTGDYNGDGNADLLYRDEASGQQEVFLTSPDGLSMATEKWLGPPVPGDSGWSYVGK